MNNTATYIKCLMEMTNITITQLARRSGVARATITRILKGQIRGSLAGVDKLLEVFDCYLAVRRKVVSPMDIDPETGKVKKPFDDPFENNLLLDTIKNEKKKTPRP